jgi:hypothetical protein
VAASYPVCGLHPKVPVPVFGQLVDGFGSLKPPRKFGANEKTTMENPGFLLAFFKPGQRESFGYAHPPCHPGGLINQ